MIKKPILQLDMKCISCSGQQGEIIKQFKTACLKYDSKPVVFRNVEFKKDQMLVFRKFLMGQCSKIVNFKEPFVKYKMSTKTLFDDMYLYMQEVNQVYHKQKGLDPMNGLPLHSYEEVSSQHWNLIYQPNASLGKPTSFITDLEQEQQKQNNFSTISSFRASSVVKGKNFTSQRNSVFHKTRHSNQSEDPADTLKKKRYSTKNAFKNNFQHSLDLTESLDDEIPEINLKTKNSIGPFLQNSNVNIKNFSSVVSKTGFRLPTHINHQSGGITPYAPKNKTMANSPRNMSLT